MGSTHDGSPYQRGRGNDHLDLLQLRAGNSLTEGGDLPERLETAPAVALDHVAARRSFQLDGREINGHQMEMSRIDTVVGAATTELWTLRIRLWRWEQFRGDLIAPADVHFCMTPQPWPRAGPGSAKDGKPKFDLSAFDQVYFDRLRERVLAAGTAETMHPSCCLKASASI